MNVIPNLIHYFVFHNPLQFFENATKQSHNAVDRVSIVLPLDVKA
jgi:hypothetical protein